MKTIFFLIAGLLVVATSMAQTDFNDSIASSRNRLKENAMLTLGGFAAANITTGFIVANNTQGSARYFWQMNAYWNFFNLGIAGLGYISTQKALAKKYSFAENLKEQKNIEKLYIVNFGLDLAYITGGLLLRHKSNTETTSALKDQFGGYGTSIIMQGGFLLLMDGLMIKLHHKNTLRLNNTLKKVEISVFPGGASVSYRF